MEELPEELRTEPCHVIALVGSNSLHAAIRDVIQKTSAEFRWNVLSLDNETMIARKKVRDAVIIVLSWFIGIYLSADYPISFQWTVFVLCFHCQQLQLTHCYKASFYEFLL